MATNGFLTATDDVRHTYEQVFWGRQLTGNNVEPQGSVMGPWTPATPEPGLNGEVLGPEASATPTGPTLLEGQIIEGDGGHRGSGPIHDHAEFYGSVWGDGSAQQIEAPQIDAPAIAPPDQGDDLTPGY